MSLPREEKIQCDLSPCGDIQWFFSTIMLLYEGEDGGGGGGVRCRGTDRDDIRLGVTGKVDGAKVVCGAAIDLKERDDEPFFEIWGWEKLPF